MTAIAKNVRPKVAATEVNPKTERRSFTAEYKLRVLEEAEACTQRGQIGALLRREGLYSSHLIDWRRQRKQGQIAALSKPRGPKPTRNTEEQMRLAELQRENRKLKAELEKAKALIDLQKKIAHLMKNDSEDLEENN